jgi:hypothetical protein
MNAVLILRGSYFPGNGSLNEKMNCGVPVPSARKPWTGPLSIPWQISTRTILSGCRCCGFANGLMRRLFPAPGYARSGTGANGLKKNMTAGLSLSLPHFTGASPARRWCRCRFPAFPLPCRVQYRSGRMSGHSLRLALLSWHIRAGRMLSGDPLPG